MDNFTLKCEVQNPWQNITEEHNRCHLISSFGCLELQRRPCEVPFPKNKVYSDVMLDKLEQSYRSFLSKKKKVDLWKLLTGIPLGSESFQDLWITRNYTMYIRNWKLFVEKKFQEKHENHWKTIKKNIKVINRPYKITADRLYIHWP